MHPLRRRLTILADAAKYDSSCASSGSRRAAARGGLGSTEGMGICHSYTPDGRCVSLLKILLTNVCIYDCQYCINRQSSNVERARFTPDEVVQLTLEFYRRNYIEGLFLSSGIVKNPDYTMEQLIRVGQLLRETHRFHGYIHLKAVPGSSPELLARAGLYADRLSANIELATESDLSRLAPEKSHADVEHAMGEIATRILERESEPRRSSGRAAPPSFAPAGQSTQLIVGATPTSDREILQTASRLYERHQLRRVYYSAFSPIPDSDARLPARPPPLAREHRLYQADWLIRHYGFLARELTQVSENLSLDIDPKLAWALERRDLFPVDVNSADRELLLRVPGFGVRSVQRILRARRQRALSAEHLRQLGVSVRRAAPFLKLASSPDAGKRARLDSLHLKHALRPPQQLELFDAARSRISGEV